MAIVSAMREMLACLCLIAAFVSAWSWTYPPSSLPTVLSGLHTASRSRGRSSGSSPRTLSMVITDIDIFAPLQRRSSLEARAIQQLVSMGRVFQAEAKSAVPARAGADYAVNWVLNGTVHLIFNEDGAVVIPIDDGRCYGEARIVDESIIQPLVDHAAICMNTCTILSVPLKGVKAFMEQQPAIGFRLQQYFSKQITSKTRKLLRPASSNLMNQSIELLGTDYGFSPKELNIDLREGSGDLSVATPGNAWRLASWNFKRELKSLRRGYRYREIDAVTKGKMSSLRSAYRRREATNLGKIGIKHLSETALQDDVVRNLDSLRTTYKSKETELFQESGLTKLSDLSSEDMPSVWDLISRWLTERAAWLDERLFPDLKPNRALNPENENVRQLQAQLRKLTLNSTAIWEREHKRMERLNQEIYSSGVAATDLAQKIRLSRTPWFIMIPYTLLCVMLDNVFDKRPISRFWFLEMVARMPYYSYISMLHLYETLGWWTVGADVRKVHFAEEWNEYHHLKIMQSLGGDVLWIDRFLARHAAIIYYWTLNLFFLLSPRLAYNFSELIEGHAVDTYGQFVDENEALLKSLKPPYEAVEYYVTGDLYMFDEFQTSRKARTRRPEVKTLYDVFANIRDDEKEHVKTMMACQINDNIITSPNSAAALARWAEEADEQPDE